MIELDKPLSDRHPLELLELNLYRARLLDDNLVRAMEKIQAAAVEMVALEEGNPGPARLHSAAASKSLMLSHKILTQIREENKSVINGLASYLEMNEVEVFESMEELVAAQEFLKQLDENEALLT